MSKQQTSSLQNTIIKNRWKLMSVLGKGAFGEVYLARDLERKVHVAVKVEKPNCKKPVLKVEMAILKKLTECEFICSFVAGGRFIAPHLMEHGSEECVYTYMVMSLSGPSLSEIRKKQPHGTFSTPTIALLGMQMIQAIEAVHLAGILHRDIKPGNFCIGIERKGRPTCHLIDFGLSRRYLTAGGLIREERSNVGFRGTARYAAISAHLGLELSRADDLWSLFYMVVEFFAGTLPWKGREKDKIGDLKQKYTKASLVQNYPIQMLHLFNYLSSLSYAATPDYDYIFSLFAEMLDDCGVSNDIQYDWDTSIGDIEMYGNEDSSLGVTQQIHSTATAAEPDKLYNFCSPKSDILEPRPPASAPNPTHYLRTRRLVKP